MVLDSLDKVAIRKFQERVYPFYAASIAIQGIYVLNESLMSPPSEGIRLLALGLFVGAAYIITSNPTSLHKCGEPSSICTKGAYGLLRHPLYSIIRGASLGGLCLYPTPENFAFSGGIFLTTELLAKSEEWELKTHFPEEYQKYKEEVPGWIPYGNKMKSYVNKALDKVNDSI